MMKVQIITRHAVPNYGSFLQAYATQQAFEECGAEVEILNYIRTDEKTFNVAKALLPYSKYADASKLKKTLYYFAQTGNILLADKRFAKYRKKYFRTTREFNSVTELSGAPKADIYCTGSDQLWGAIGNDEYDEAYFLSYADGRKISYAASFGSAEVDEKLLMKVKPFLDLYSAVTVREQSAKDILGSIGIDSSVVVDPTLLMDTAQWDKSLGVKHGTDKKYVLVYQIHRNPEMDAYAEKFAEKAGLPLYRVTPTVYQAFRSGKTELLPSPDKFLSLISGAQYLITNSFHGTAFALQYHVPMVCVSSGKTMTRIENLLYLAHQSGRILGDYDDFHYIGSPMDFSESDEEIARSREQSLTILKDLLKGNI